MRLAARTVVTPSLDVVKMEERKRPVGSDDSAPPAKRQALAVNGARSHPDADLPFKDDIEVRPLPTPVLLTSHQHPANKSMYNRPSRKMPSTVR
jgi:hypothetical protein